MRVLLLSATPGAWAEKSETLFFAPKPPPVITSPSEDRKRFVLGSLSHILNQTANGYLALPEFPAVAPDPSVRRPVLVDLAQQQNFYEEEEEDEEEEGEEEEEEEDDFYGPDDGEEEEEEPEEEEVAEEEEEEAPTPPPKSKSKPSAAPAPSADPFAAFFSAPAPVSPPSASPPPPVKATASFDELFAPVSAPPQPAQPPANLKRYSVLENAAGLQLECAYTRAASPNGPEWRVLQLYFKNLLTDAPLTGIKMAKQPSIDGSDVQPFQDIALIPPGADYHCALHVKFVTAGLPVRFDLVHTGASHAVSLRPAVGELLRTNPLSTSEFDQIFSVLSSVGSLSAALSGLGTDAAAVSARVLELAVLSVVPSDESSTLKYVLPYATFLSLAAGEMITTRY
jgi:AP-3 complex subunit beta